MVLTKDRDSVNQLKKKRDIWVQNGRQYCLYCKVGVGVSVLTKNDEMSFGDGDDARFDK